MERKKEIFSLCRLVSAAIGWIWQDPKIDVSANSVIKRADSLMYEN